MDSQAGGHVRIASDIEQKSRKQLEVAKSKAPAGDGVHMCASCSVQKPVPGGCKPADASITTCRRGAAAPFSCRTASRHSGPRDERSRRSSGLRDRRQGSTFVKIAPMLFKYFDDLGLG